jgi:hypothetical protein
LGRYFWQKILAGSLQTHLPEFFGQKILLKFEIPPKMFAKKYFARSKTSGRTHY